MTDASRDQNHVPGKLGVWCVDGVTTIPIAFNESNGGVKIDIMSTVSYVPTPIDREDKNFVDVWLFEGSDGLTYPCNVNASGALLVDF